MDHGVVIGGLVVIVVCSMVHVMIMMIIVMIRRCACCPSCVDSVQNGNCRYEHCDRYQKDEGYLLRALHLRTKPAEGDRSTDNSTVLNTTAPAQSSRRLGAIQRLPT